MRLARSIAYAGAAILAISLVWHEHAAPSAANTPALFDSDPRHVSNRLYRALHVRTVPDGKQYGFDTLDPLLWSETNHLLEGKSHQQAIALADEFLRTHAERQITDPLKRAILQRDLWAVLDWADQPDQPNLFAHQSERRELISRLAPIVRSLALSPEELATLPDTYARALQLHEFPAAYDSANPNRAFLPPELFDPVAPGSASAPRLRARQSRSTTSSFTAPPCSWFLPLPGGRDPTLTSSKQLPDMKIPLFVNMKDPNWPQPMDVWNPQVPQFPAGTEFALVRN